MAFGLLQEFTEVDLPPLYHPPGLLRPWLVAPERLSPADADRVHGQLAMFWRECYEADREAERRVRIDVELLACREHARFGKDARTFRWATVRLAQRLERHAEWRASRELLEEIPEADRDADCLMALASVEESLGDWKLARTHLEQALANLPDGTRDKAATWHNLATIDVREGNYGPAREKFEKSLRIKQAIGDRAGEAATFHQLGILAHRMGRGHVGARLVALCWMIDRDIGHGDAESDFRDLSSLCSELSYEQRQFDAMLKEAAAAYQADRGHSLIKRAFAVSGEGGKDPGIDGRE